MNRSRILLFSLIVVSAPAFCQAQGRWDKFQKKMEELRPKGKLIQQIKDGFEGEPSAEGPKADPEALKSKPVGKPVSQTQSSSSRRVPAQQASRRSILNTARALPSGGVVLGIQVDPGFLPSQKLVISEVDSESPAALAGIRTGDQITSVGGIPTNSLKALDGVLSSLNAGDQVVVEFLRNRKSERTLVRFEKPAGSAADAPTNQLEPDAAELPPPPDVLDAPMISPGHSPPEGLRSVLSAKSNPTPASIGTHRGPTYFPANLGTPQVVGNGQIEGPVADDLAVATPDQLRARIREQQQLIEQLQLQLHQLTMSDRSPAQDQAESESLILDPNGN